jgi:hypothetical protein
MNIIFIIDIPIPDFLNEDNYLELFDIDNDYNIIDDLYNNNVYIDNKHLYIVLKLIDLNWELKRIYYSVISYYTIIFDNNTIYINYINDSLKIFIYYQYRNEIISNNNFIIDFDNDIQNDLLLNIDDLNSMKYKDVNEELKNKYKDCNICYEQFNDDINVILLNCSGKHIYCYDCIINWLKNYNNNCPICKNI